MTYNNAFLYVTAMLIFLIYPFVAVTVYLKYALERRTSMLCRFPHRIFITHDTIEITYENLMKTDDEGKLSIMKEAPESEKIRRASIRHIMLTSGKTIIEGPEPYMLLIIPQEAYANQSDMVVAEELLLNKTRTL